MGASYDMPLIARRKRGKGPRTKKQARALREANLSIHDQQGRARKQKEGVPQPPATPLPWVR